MRFRLAVYFVDLDYRSRVDGVDELGVASRQVSRSASGPSLVGLVSTTCAGSGRLHLRIGQLCDLLESRTRRRPHPSSTQSRGRAAQVDCSYADSNLAGVGVSCIRSGWLHRAPLIHYQGNRGAR